MTYAKPLQSEAETRAPLSRGLRFAGEIVCGFVLPAAIYRLCHDRLGDVPALLIAAAPPILWSIAAFVRERRLDTISILALAGIALSLLAFAGGGGVMALQLREALVAGLVGLVFLGSVAIGRPLIYHLSRAGVRRRAAHRLEDFDSVAGDRRLRRDMTVATLVWGVGLLASCALHCVLVVVLSITAYLLVAPPTGYAILGGLTAWTFWFVPRAIHRAAERRDEAAKA